MVITRDTVDRITQPTRASRNRSSARDALAAIHRTVNLAVLGGLAVQFYLAGGAMFGAVSLMPHRAAGFLLLLLSLASAIVALVARHRHAQPLHAFLLFGLMFLQPILVMGFRRLPAVAALHALNAAAMIVVALWIEYRVRHSRATSW
jgi:hypothetical protein